MRPQAQARLVLCGGIGSGKSAAGRLFAEQGAFVIDADEVGHRVLEPGTDTFERVAQRWPEVVLEGRIDRGALGSIVFSDPDQLAELEAMTHPAIRSEIATRVSESSAPVVVVEVPLLNDLLGPGWLRVVVDAPDETRAQRLRDRGMTDADIAQRMAAQAPRERWIEVADEIIDNSASLEDLAAEVKRLVVALEEI